MDESEAIARLQQGDWSGLDVLVARYQVPAARAAYLIVRDPALAADLVQDAFVRAAERIGQFDPHRPFGPWFLRNVVNAAVRAARRQERQQVWDPDDVESPLQRSDPALALDEQMVAGETRAAIWAALGALPPDQRAAIVLRYYLDLSEAEMTDRLAVPRGTVKWRLHTARQRLRTLLPGWLRPAGAGTLPRPTRSEEDLR